VQASAKIAREQGVLPRRWGTEKTLVGHCAWRYPRAMRRWFRAGLVLSVVLVTGTSIAKGVCSDRPKARIYPDLTLPPAPTNAHVWVELPRGWQAQGLCGSSSAPCVAGQFEIALESAPIRGRPSRGIAAIERQSVSGTVATVELVPQPRLEADSRYEVWLRDRSGKNAPRIIGVLRTSNRTDEEKPSWGGLIKSAPSSKLPGGCGSPLVVLPVERPIDNTGVVRHAVWVSDEDGRIDYAMPPLIYTEMLDITAHEGAPSKRNILLGSTEPDVSDFERPRYKNGFRLGVRAVDWAGNMSEPSEIQLR
jgi:hypothetical protein